MKKLISTLLAVLMLSCCVMSVMASGSITTVAPSIGTVAPSIGTVAPSIGGVAPSIGGVAPSIGSVTVAPADLGGALADVAAKAAAAAPIAEIFAGFEVEGVDLTTMKQVTDLMVIEAETEEPVVVAVEGFEAIMGGTIEEFVILFVSADGSELSVLTMTEYDAATGDFSFEAPGAGAFLVASVG